jgi:hypothetical protein
MVMHINGLPLATYYLLTVTDSSASVQYTERVKQGSSTALYSECSFSANIDLQLHGNILVFLVAYRPTNANILVRPRVPGSAPSNPSINAATLVHKHISITERAPEF